MAGPLEGIRVIDLTSMVSGPMATCVLGDQGAEVVKVEIPGTGDLIRHIGCARGGLSAIFTTLNRNKRSIVLNLRQPHGRELLHKLLAGADVLVQNFRPGVMHALGFGEAELRPRYPDLVYVSISGFGETGPYARRRVYDIIIQAISGMAASQADPKTGVPELERNIVCDKVTAVTAAQAITAALFARERGAGGQHVRLSMLDTAIAFLWPDTMQSYTFLGEGVTPPAPLAGLLSVRQTKDGHMTIFAISDAEFGGLCRALDCPELSDDPRFADVTLRTRNADLLAELLDRATGAHTTAELCARLEVEDVPHAAVTSLESLHRHPQVIENRLLVESEHPHAGRTRTPRPVASFEATPATLRRPAPALGEHTDELLAELGLTEGEIHELRAEGVLR
ncbi:MAG: CaiB/BaiF CoA-transferase family protein [Deltaproteobacteria bacterium]|nr:CaiB/BaiF CoA-transferase family protein [Deltaproteobacteria bacterium]